MKWIGVITGDIVGSSEILKAGERDKLLEVMKGTVEEIHNNQDFGNVKIDIYRGDSFQIIVDDVRDVLGIAILFRANLISKSNKNLRWDARLGIGTGHGEYLADKVSESDGEAFHLSGKSFDELDKNSCLSILTQNENFNSEFFVSTAFVDDIISNWTITQASTYFLAITNQMNQREISNITKKTPQTISKIVAAGKFHLIANYYLRYFKQIAKLTH